MGPIDVFEPGKNYRVTTYDDTQTMALACSFAGFKSSDFHQQFTPGVPGLGPIWSNDFVCYTEAEAQKVGGRVPATLNECAYPSTMFPAWTSDHSYDLTIDCDYPRVNATRPKWEFRLSKELRRGHGRLEMRPDPTHSWGAVMGRVSPEMACRAAGFNDPPPTFALSSVGNIAVKGVKVAADPLLRQWATFNCTFAGADGLRSDGKTLSDCVDGPQWSEVSFVPHNHQVDRAKDLWIDCYPELSYSLVGGADAMEGRIRVSGGAYGGTSSALCNDGFDRDPNAQLAMCHAAGLTNATHAEYKYFGFDAAQKFLTSELTCPPREVRALERCFRQPTRLDAPTGHVCIERRSSRSE